jgi:hypothetical protein
MPHQPGRVPRRAAGWQGEACRRAGERVGASKVSMYPRPEDYGGTWEHDPARCQMMDHDILTRLAADTQPTIDHVATARSPWPENPNCIYKGGFGIGPANPGVEFEKDPGLWVRSIAIGDGTDTLVLTVIDAEGYLWDYSSKCARWCEGAGRGPRRGARHRPDRLRDRGDHSHAGSDLIGGRASCPTGT